MPFPVLSGVTPKNGKYCTLRIDPPYVIACQVDVIPTKRRQVSQELVRDILPVAHFRNGFLKANCVPENNGRNDKVETGRAVALVLERTVADLTEAIDTTSTGGRMIMQMVGTFAEFERAMLRERTRNGLDAARKQGRVGGRRQKLKTHQQEEILNLVNSAGQKNAADAARLFNVHPAIVSRLLQRGKIP